VSAAKPGPGHNSGNPIERATRVLQGAVRRIEVLDAEIAGLNAEKSDVFKEVKQAGFDPAAVRGAIRYRRDPEAAEQHSAAVQSVIELIGAAVPADAPAADGGEAAGLDSASRARARAHVHVREGDEA
jgi:uncharacterized protein (UPF0335 family)